MKVRTVAVAVALVAVAGAVGVRAATDEPRRAPLRLPAASAFPAGPCRDAAAAVLALGRFTYEHAEASGLPADAYPFLRQRAEELAAVRGRTGRGEAAEGAPGGGAASGAPSGGASASGAPNSGAPGESTSASGAPNSGASASGATENPPGSGATDGMPTGGTSSPPRTTDADPQRQALSAHLDAVLTAIGFLRLRPGKAYDPALLRDLEKARADLQKTCVSQA